MTQPLPTYDPTAFAAWLRRWRDAEKLRWTDIAEASGISYGAVMSLAGNSRTLAAGRKSTGTAPSVETLCRLAHGLGLEVGYVLEKAGVATTAESRWSNFTTAERNYIAKALHEYELRHSIEGALHPEHAAELLPAPEGRKLTEELERFLNQ